MSISKLSIHAVLPDNGVKSMSDKGLRLTFDTREPTEEQFREIFKMKGLEGKLVFASDEANIESTDLEDLNDGEPKKKKSPSQKLRSKMYVYYSNNYSDVSGFDAWYEKTLDTIGETYLAKVEK